MLTKSALIVSTLLASWSTGAFGQEHAPDTKPVYRVIVNPSNPTTAIDKKQLAEIFLKRSTRWSNGVVARPADLGTESSIRKKFSDEVLNRSVLAVKSYWQQVIFSGRDVPPPELDSDEEIVKFVLKNAGAVGYVSSSADLNGAKILTVK